MPIHLISQNRRQFLITAGAGAAAAALVTPSFAGEGVDGDLFYLLNDTHIGEKHPSNSPVPSHLRQVVDELVALEKPPTAVLINGDLALYDGQPGDYRHLKKLLQPLRDAGINLHLTMGNHDHRETFYQVLQEERPEQPVVQSRHISIVPTKHANFFLLDSLQKTLVTQGTLGEEQRGWLAKTLDSHADKPALIVTHHNPRLGGDPVHFPGGLIDSQPLWDVLAPRKHVKAYLHGHIHHRGNYQHAGIHILNLPAISYVANPETSTTGWTTARLDAGGMTLTTHTSNPQHAWNGEELRLKWRG